MVAPNAAPAPPIPDRLSFKALGEAVQECRACELWEGATQAVMGTGPAPGKARLMLVGEQPGDREDIEGRPFVGPAGQLLDRGLERAGIDRREAYVSNVVKHFRYKLRGKRRIHQTPERVHIVACRPWLDAELRLVKPRALVCLGATAAQALLGSHVRVGRDRGRPVESDLADLVTLTTHPSAILRQRDEAERAAAMDEFVADLAGVARWLAEH
ncbi:MAG TPA: UdgX family uracil-DNA binding protein [Solirubrobacteraceae bacterium]|nr:UdgX family uracil-DNA binding protein [Solirubrobacteraceae bacterium]